MKKFVGTERTLREPLVTYPDDHPKWRHWSNSNLEQDLAPGAYLSGTEAHGGDFSGRDLRGINLSDARFQYMHLRHALLADANCCNANFQGTRFDFADLTRVNFIEAKLWCVSAQDADFSHALLYGADLYDSDLRGANLQDADLMGADLTRTDLRGATLGLNVMQCTSFFRAKISKEQIPFFMCHPKWGQWVDKITID